MNDRLDKIAPGLTAKLNLFFDEVFAILAVLLAVTPTHPLTDSHIALVCGAVMLSWFVAAALLRLYSPCTPRTNADSLVLCCLAVVIVLCSVALARLWLWQPGEAPLSLAVFTTVLASTTLIARFTFLKAFKHLEPASVRVLIVGTGAEGLLAYRRLAHSSDERCAVAGFVRLPGQPAPPRALGVPLLGELDALGRVLGEHPVTEVYVATSFVEHAREIQRVVQACEEVGMPFALPIDSVRFERAELLSPASGRDGFLHYQTMRAQPGQYAAKRLIDILASAFALLVLSPLLLGVAAAIKLTSKGPVLFRQERVGLHGSSFSLLKFRSMVADAEDLREALLKRNEQTGPVFKIANDPRVTAVGRFIRKYSIDELPQLINVLRGDMTLVGPRPALPKEVAQYKAWQRRRLSVRPGLTCYWQVGGRNNIGFEEWMRLDLRYVDNWSLAVDLRLIARTVPVVLAGRGAS